MNTQEGSTSEASIYFRMRAIRQNQGVSQSDTVETRKEINNEYIIIMDKSICSGS